MKPDASIGSKTQGLGDKTILVAWRGVRNGRYPLITYSIKKYSPGGYSLRKITEWLCAASIGVAIGSNADTRKSVAQRDTAHSPKIHRLLLDLNAREAASKPSRTRIFIT